MSRRAAKNFPNLVEAMLLSEEDADVVWISRLAVHMLYARIPFGRDDSRRFIVIIGCAGRYRIATETDKAHCLRVRADHVVSPNRIEQVELSVQQVAAILGREQYPIV